MNVTDFEVSEETLKYLEHEFRKRDKDRSGTIDCSELEECLQLCGILPTREDIVFLQKHFDTSGDKELEIGELLENIDVINAHSLQGHRLMNTFRRLDPRGTGFIRNKALKDLLKDHMRWDEAEKYISHLARTYDSNKDGKFNYPEFVGMMVCEADPLKEKLEKKKKNRCN